MSRKDYQLIAAAILRAHERANRKGMDTGTIFTVADEIAKSLKTDNTRFNDVRFLDACGFARFEVEAGRR